MSQDNDFCPSSKENTEETFASYMIQKLLAHGKKKSDIAKRINITVRTLNRINQSSYEPGLPIFSELLSYYCAICMELNKEKEN